MDVVRAYGTVVTCTRLPHELFRLGADLPVEGGSDTFEAFLVAVGEQYQRLVPACPICGQPTKPTE